MSVTLKAARGQNELHEKLRSVTGVREVHPESETLFHIQTESDEKILESLAEVAVASGAGLLELAHEKASLEDIFLKLTYDQEGAAAAKEAVATGDAMEASL